MSCVESQSCLFPRPLNLSLLIRRDPEPGPESGHLFRHEPVGFHAKLKIHVFCHQGTFLVIIQKVPEGTVLLFGSRTPSQPLSDFLPSLVRSSNQCHNHSTFRPDEQIV
jgi:hypothetical protein